MKSKSVETYSNPTLGATAKLFKEGLEKGKTLLLIGNCWVDYRGRASSKLEPGERILIIKEDRAVLVHRSSGYEPINWMPGGVRITFQVNLVHSFGTKSSRFETLEKQLMLDCTLETPSTKNILQIRAIRRRPSESLKISFEKVYLFLALTLVDYGQFFLHSSEEDMQKAILLKPEIVEPGLKPIAFEKKVEPGFIDVYGIDKDGRFVVIEIKRKIAGRNAVLQLAKYVESLGTPLNREVRGILVAPCIAKGVQRLLVTLKLDFKSLDPKKCAEILRKPETTKKLIEYLGEENDSKTSSADKHLSPG